jgi:hypothetical protein
MVYTISQGAQGANSRLHYSLYGGVEYYPENSFAWKELLPLVAIPAVAIALLAAILNFHVPKLSPSEGGSGQGATSVSGNKAYSLVVSPPHTTSSSPSKNSSGTPAVTSGSGSPTAVSTSPITSLVPAGNDNGQGIVGGMGGGDSGGTTAPTPTTDPSSLVNVNTSISGTTAQVGVDVFSPVNNKPLVSTSTTIDP